MNYPFYIIIYWEYHKILAIDSSWTTYKNFYIKLPTFEIEICDDWNLIQQAIPSPAKNNDWEEIPF